MAHLIYGDNVTEAWLAAVAHLRSVHREQYDLLVEIGDPTPTAVEPQIIAELDHLLARKGLQSVATVANTIFPTELAHTSTERGRLYQRYAALLPRLRQNPKNKKGTYFERLISYPPRQGRDEPINQVELIVQDLDGELRHRAQGKAAMRHIYEAQIYSPGRDRRPWGFPCMSSLSFHLDGNQLRLSATYRNQYYVERALGNFLGLAGLQRFISGTAGLSAGPLTIHAFHAELERRATVNEVDALLRGCRGAVHPRRIHPSMHGQHES